MSTTIVFSTARLFFRLAQAEDADFIKSLWNDPRVMDHVGFPSGLKISLEQVITTIKEQTGDPLDGLLIIEHSAWQKPIGQAKLGRPDEDGLVEPDIKLQPDFWGQGFGREAFKGMVDYLSQHIQFSAIQTTPHIDNIASIRMVEAAGGVRVGQSIFTFPPSMASYTSPVPHFIYHIPYPKLPSEKIGKGVYEKE